MKKFVTFLAALFIVSLSPCASMLAHTAKAMEAMSMKMTVSEPHQGSLMDCCHQPQLKMVETAISTQPKSPIKAKAVFLPLWSSVTHHCPAETQFGLKQKVRQIKIVSTVQRE